MLLAEKRSGRVSLAVSAGQHASPPPRPVLLPRVSKRHYLQVPSGLPKDLVRHNHCGESRGRGDQTRAPRKTEGKPRAGRRPPAPEVSTSSHRRGQVTRRSRWATDPPQASATRSATLEGRACDTLQMETEARQGQGDPRAHLRGLGHAAARGEACACPGAVILWRSCSGNGECPLQANPGVRARAGGWVLQSLGRAPDHREDGPTPCAGSAFRQRAPPGGAGGVGPPRGSLGFADAGGGPACGNPRAGGGPASGHGCKRKPASRRSPCLSPKRQEQGEGHH